jgi:hypothetical protein
MDAFYSVVHLPRFDTITQILFTIYGRGGYIDCRSLSC